MLLAEESRQTVHLSSGVSDDSCGLLLCLFKGTLVLPIVTSRLAIPVADCPFSTSACRCHVKFVLSCYITDSEDIAQAISLHAETSAKVPIASRRKAGDTREAKNLVASEALPRYRNIESGSC
eukprot:6201322-Pleurochrysis_carterae.AAC.3